MFSGVVPANVVDLPVELSVLWIFKCFSTIESSNSGKITHLIDPVINSVSANLHLGEHWQERKAVTCPVIEEIVCWPICSPVEFEIDGRLHCERRSAFRVSCAPVVSTRIVVPRVVRWTSQGVRNEESGNQKACHL